MQLSRRLVVITPTETTDANDTPSWSLPILLSSSIFQRRQAARTIAAIIVATGAWTRKNSMS